MQPGNHHTHADELTSVSLFTWFYSTSAVKCKHFMRKSETLVSVVKHRESLYLSMIHYSANAKL